MDDFLSVFVLGFLGIFFFIYIFQKLFVSRKKYEKLERDYDSVCCELSQWRQKEKNLYDEEKRFIDDRKQVESAFLEKVSRYEEEYRKKVKENESAFLEKVSRYEEEYRKKVKKNESAFLEEVSRLNKKFEKYKTHIEQSVLLLLDDKSISMPWLAEMVADCYNFVVDETRCTVTNVSGLKNEIVNLKRENKLLQYNLSYLKNLFPEVEENIVDFSIKQDDYEYLTKEEFDSLSTIEKNKLALERYKKNRKGKHNIGRDFEMYIGYMFEQRGFSVKYFGIEKKLQDLGRDLIAENEKTIYVVQCKYWSKDKIIHEKHICQLYGTYIKYKLENKTNKNIIPIFICHNAVSSIAKEFAQELNVEIIENIDIKDYPMIKCNLKECIYHLPFDQQYDNLLFENCTIVSTIEEADELGCRRAYKWRGRT